MSDSKAPLDVGWLADLFVECGLDDAQARSAAEVTRVRLATRALGFRYNRPKGRTFLAPHLLKDPLSSFNRIVGKAEYEIPMYDDATGQLSVVAVASVLREIGLEVDVALAFARVVVEVASVSDFFQPVWAFLGGSGDVDLTALRKMDWAPLRRGLSDDPKVAAHMAATEVDAAAVGASRRGPRPRSGQAPRRGPRAGGPEGRRRANNGPNRASPPRRKRRDDPES